MLNQLRKIYLIELFQYDQQNQAHIDDYMWFITNKNKVFGILRQ